MLYMSHLGADVIAEISLDDDDDEDLQEEESGVCSSSHCQIVIIGGSMHCQTMYCLIKKIITLNFLHPKINFKGEEYNFYGTGSERIAGFLLKWIDWACHNNIDSGMKLRLDQLFSKKMADKLV